KISGNGLQAQSNHLVIGASPVFLTGGTQTILTNLDLAPYFRLENLQGISAQQYSRSLPEGQYRICWEVYDFFTNQRISHPTMGCTFLYLIENDPPILNIPIRGEQVAATDMPNIVFQWTPRHRNATNVRYTFELRELWDTYMEPQSAFLATPNLYTEETYATALVYQLGKPTLLAGKRYGWRVRAVSTRGLSENAVFKNNGYSEIYHFEYNKNCKPPRFALASPESSGRVKVQWQGDIDHQRYMVQYRKAGVEDAEWFSVKTTNSQAQIGNLQPGTTYEFRVGGSCDAITALSPGYTYTAIHEFGMPSKEEAKTYSCGIVPEIEISNTNPLENLGVNEVFTAGDFPVTVKIIEGEQGNYSGKGYIVVPYLADTKIAVEFKNISINTDYQLVEGKITTTYDATWGGVEDIQETIDDLKEAGEELGDIIKDIFGDEEEDVEDEESEEDVEHGESDESGEERVEDDKNEDSGATNDSEESQEDTDNNNDHTGDGSNPNDNNNNSSDNSESEESNITEEEIVIKYKGKDYKHKSIIKIPFKRNLGDQEFRIINIKDDYKIDWSLHHSFETINAFAAAGNGIKTSLDVKNFEEKTVLQAEYWKDSRENAKKIQVLIQISRKKFKMKELYAFDGKKRVAKSGETLYLIDKPSLSYESRKINFAIVSNPKIIKKELPKNSIRWQIDFGNQLEWKDKKDVYKNIREQESTYRISALAGYPKQNEKEVRVKWIPQDFSMHNDKFDYGFSLMPYLKEFAEKVGVPVYHEKDKYDTNNGFSILANLQFVTETRNKIDINSRLFYKEEKQTVKTALGVKGTFEKGIPYLSLPNVNKKFLGVEFDFALGIYFFMEAQAFGEIGHTKYTEEWVEEKNRRNKTYSKYGDPANLKLLARLGLDPKLVLKASEKISGKISGKSFVEAVLINYDVSKNKINFPVTDGLLLKCEPMATFTFFGRSYTHQFDRYEYEINW
ncbi:MAG: fibronectin type III domain-containing protein, partial [Flavobacteriaceae bacterium]|nr:fibronectin type III domain-containing protein [Flavobacteriaceae bacterium]